MCSQPCAGKHEKNEKKQTSTVYVIGVISILEKILGKLFFTSQNKKILCHKDCNVILTFMKIILISLPDENPHTWPRDTEKSDWYIPG